MNQILIIEDDTLLQDIYQKALAPEGFTVTQAFSGGQGLNLAKSQKPNLIILDVMLPGGMNGFDVLEKLKKDPEVREIPVLVLTNLDSEEKSARAIGAADYIVKANSSIEGVIKKIKQYIKNPISA